MKAFIIACTAAGALCVGAFLVLVALKATGGVSLSWEEVCRPFLTIWASLAIGVAASFIAEVVTVQH